MLRSPAHRFRVAAAATALPVLLHGAFVMRTFDGLYGQDPYAYLAYALGPLREWLTGGGAMPGFHWPPGYPLLVALASWVVGASARAGQLVALLAAASVPPATAALARGLDVERRGALLAGVAAALTGQLWQSSVVVMADTPSLAALVWGAVALVWWQRPDGERRPWLLVAGAAAIGVAILCRWSAALAALPLIALAALGAARRPLGRGLVPLAAGGLVGAAVLAPVLAPAVAALAGAPRPGPSFTIDLEVMEWRPSHLTSRRFTNADGTQEYPLTNLAFYGLAPARRVMLSPLGALLLLPGLAALLRRPRRDQLLVLVAWPAVVLGYVTGITYQVFRFVLPVLPPLAVLAGLGADRVLAATSARSRRVVMAGLLIAAGWMVWGGIAITRFYIVRERATAEVVERVAVTTPAGARVLAFGCTLALDHAGRVDARELWARDPASLATLLAEPGPVFLVADLATVRGQWGDKTPGLALAWLESHTTLEPLWTLHGYTLLAVRPADRP